MGDHLGFEKVRQGYLGLLVKKLIDVITPIGIFIMTPIGVFRLEV